MSLDVEGLRVSYTTANGTAVDAVEDVDLTIARGEFVTLLGPSGCGKSTILHCLGGLMEPTAGGVTIDGNRVRPPNPRRAAFVFQDYALLPWRSIIDNVAIGLQFGRIEKRERRRRAVSYLEMVGLGAYAESYPEELSGGMQQRVAVARALAMEPDVLLLDEPFGAVDEQSRRRLGVEMSALLSSTDKTMVMVTHSLDEAIFWADRVLVISARPGRVVAEIKVDAPRPRGLGFMMTGDFESLRSQLFRLLEEQAELQQKLAASTTGSGAADAS